MTVEVDAPFSEDTARNALHLAATDIGLPIADARLIRMGENAIFALPSAGVVARIARSDIRRDRVEKELAIARWLAHHDYPAVRIAEHLPQPVPAHGRLITFWQLVEVTGEPTYDHLAALLRDFHALPAPDHPLPQFDPFVAVPTRLANPGNAEPAAVDYLTDLYHQLQTQYTALDFGPQTIVIHGDAHLGNIIPTPNGPLLSDFEVVAHGPHDWDLTTTAMSLDRFAMPHDVYDNYARIYGRDVTKSPDYPTLRAVRELTMVTWLMQIIDVSPKHADEFTHRIASMRDGDTRRQWHAF